MTEYTWYSFEELVPVDKYWVLVADDRFKTPKKALFKYDIGASYLEYDDGITTDDTILSGGSLRKFEHAYAWTPMPMMPTREQVEKGLWRG